MLEIFGLQKGSFEYRRLVSAFERIFGATIFFGSDRTRTNSMLIQRSRFNFLREAQSWYDRRPSEPLLSAAFENVIVLSDDFYREITEHPIPTDLEAIRVLSGSPAVLDLFIWLSYRCSSARDQDEFLCSAVWVWHPNWATLSTLARGSSEKSCKVGCK